jgi:hypothetical protein
VSASVAAEKEESMIADALRLALGCVLVAALCAAPTRAWTQDEGGTTTEEEQRTPAGAGGGAPEQPAPEAAVPEGPTMRQAGGAQQGFQISPTVTNTYIVTTDVRGLKCVVGVGSTDACAVVSQTADEGGAPWNRLKCRAGDSSVSTFAWSIDKNKAISVFEAPPALANGSQTRAINVRLGRVCMKANAAPKARRAQ